MVDHMGSGWSDFARMGYLTVEAHAEAVRVKEEQLDWLTYIQLDFITCIVTSLFGDNINVQQSPYIDKLQPIVLTSENLQLLNGTQDSLMWLDKPETQPAVKLWAHLLFCFGPRHHQRAGFQPAC
eukprot:1206157-Rhodomonas_salina.1